MLYSSIKSLLLFVCKITGFNHYLHWREIMGYTAKVVSLP